jgi:hypothetical protein
VVKYLGDDEDLRKHVLHMQEEHEENKEELAEALASSRGIIEGWLYKTAQALGIFKQKVFHKRYYRLNLMTEDLKIFDKPDGTLKHEIDLSGNVIMIDIKLNFKNISKKSKQLGTVVALPFLFNYPIAIFTKTEVMILWCRNNQEQATWSQGFEQLMKRTEK